MAMEWEPGTLRRAGAGPHRAAHRRPGAGHRAGDDIPARPGRRLRARARLRRAPTTRPSRHAEELLTELEGGAALAAVRLGHGGGDRGVPGAGPGRPRASCREVMYWALRGWLLDHGIRWGLAVELVDTTDLDALAAALRPGRTRLVWLETPANPLWEISDIAAAAEIAHRAGARLAVDSTVATPVLTRPLALGADLVMHSATKYLNGHSDVIAGTLTTAPGTSIGHGSSRCAPGRAASPAASRRGCSCAACARSSCACAIAAARRSSWPSDMAGHPRVAQVLYPGLPDFPGHAARRPPDDRAASAACCRSGCAAARRPRSPRRRG